MIQDPCGGLSPLRPRAGGVCSIEALVRTGSPMLRFAETVEKAPGR